MPSDFTLEEIARAIVRIENSINQLVRRDIFDVEISDVQKRVERIEGWLTWGTRIVIGAVMTGVLSFVVLSR